MFRIRLLLALCLVWCDLPRVDAKHKQVDASLTASWSHTPLIFEALEFLEDVDSDLFRRGCQLVQQIPKDSDQAECWPNVWEIVKQLLPPALQPIFYLQMSTRHFSARIEAFRNMYLQHEPPDNNSSTCAVAHLHGQRFDDPLSLSKALVDCTGHAGKHAARSSPPLSIDHILYRPYRPECHVVLYAAPMTASFAAMEQAITEATQAGAVLSYALRPVLLDGCADLGTKCLVLGKDLSPVLAGFGVELFIKDTEYSQVNEVADNGGTSQQTQKLSGAAVPTEVSHLESDDGKPPAVKDLAVQTAQLVAESANPLELLVNITRSFPALASGISRVKVTKKFLEACESMGRLGQTGANFLLINGLAVGTDENINFAVLESVLLRDSLSIAALHRAGLHAQDARAMLTLRAHDQSAEPTVRLDLRTPTCFWLNDLENDAAYRRWPSTLQGFLSQQTMFGPPATVARNAINIQLIMEPLSAASFQPLASVLQLHGQQYPVRIGVFFILPESDRGPAPAPYRNLSPAGQFLRLFVLMDEAFSTLAAWQFWLALMQASSGAMRSPYDDYDPAESPPLSGKQVEEAFRSIWVVAQEQVVAQELGKRSVDKVLKELQKGKLPEIDQLAHRHVTHLSSTGVSGGAHVAINGKLHGLEGSAMAVMQLVFDEMGYMAQLVHSGKIQDSVKDVYGHILEAEGAAPAHSDLVLSSSDADALEHDATANSIPNYVLGDSILGPSLRDHAVLQYLHTPGTRDLIKPVTHWLVLSVLAPDARQTLASAVEYIRGSEAKQARLSVMFECASVEQDKAAALMRILHAAASLKSRLDKIPLFLNSLATDEALWKRLASSHKGALQSAVALAEQSGLNVDALQAILDRLSWTNGLAVRLTVPRHRTLC
eukprot:jgi/Ulvmu1/12054/UM083_0067.1